MTVPTHDLFRHARQVHLDFHTSPFIPDVGSEFDAAEFARTFKRASVNSVTVFAKCHHGQCYYPAKIGVPHPALNGRDLLGEQIEALHREGIRCPIYTTVGWEEDAAARHPEWRQLTKDGFFVETAALNGAPTPGKWKFLDFLHPDYQDYIEAQVREICERYPVDGLFFDILAYYPRAHYGEASLRFRAERGLEAEDQATFERFQGAAIAAFTAKFTRLVNELAPGASVFYNSGNESNMDPGVGPRVRSAHMSHYEIESLPSGFWGYYHFPRMARMQSRWGKFWLSQTGRFQKMWGDFGGIKPQAALEFECFRTQALGGGNMVGDQLPPRGKLEKAAYDLIGAVYAQVAAAESFYQGTERVSQLAVFSASWPGRDGGKSEEAAVQMCEECHYDAAVIDGQDEFDSFPLLILPDSTVVVPELAKRLAAYHRKGGRLLISHRAGFDVDGKWALDFLPLSFHGETEKYPTYWRAREEFDADLAGSDRVFYQAGLNATGGPETRTLIDRVLPYFKRSDLRFCSHFQTPPVAEADRFPAVLGGERWIYFADPIFSEYRQAGSIAVRDGWRRAVRHLIGEAPIGEGLPTTVLSYPRRVGNDLRLTLLHYVPVRKALDIDVIEERHSFAGERLVLKGFSGKVRVHDGAELEPDGEGSWRLPAVKGRLLLEAKDFFRSKD